MLLFRILVPLNDCGLYLNRITGGGTEFDFSLEYQTRAYFYSCIYIHANWFGNTHLAVIGFSAVSKNNVRIFCFSQFWHASRIVISNLECKGSLKCIFRWLKLNLSGCLTLHLKIWCAFPKLPSKSKTRMYNDGLFRA